MDPKSTRLFWRTIITDSESPDGLAPRCSEPHNPDEILGCCPPDLHLEVHDTALAAHLVTLLNDSTAAYHSQLKNCPSTSDRLHCSHYQEGDGDCCHCARPNWLPKGGL